MLKRLRTEQGMTLRKLAELSGVPHRTIHCWELRGAEHAVAGKLKKVADALGVKVDDLL